jgi:hypothetical protein
MNYKQSSLYNTNQSSNQISTKFNKVNENHNRKQKGHWGNTSEIVWTEDCEATTVIGLTVK